MDRLTIDAGVSAFSPATASYCSKEEIVGSESPAIGVGAAHELNFRQMGLLVPWTDEIFWRQVSPLQQSSSGMFIRYKESPFSPSGLMGCRSKTLSNFDGLQK